MTLFIRLTAILSLSLATLLLSSCGNTPVKPIAEPTAETLSLETLQDYINKREGLTSAQVTSRRIDAANFLLQNKQIDRALKLIDTIDANVLDEANELRYLLLNAQIAIEIGEPLIAQRYLFSEVSDSARTQAPTDTAITFYDLRAQLLQDQAQYFESVDERLMLSTLLGDDEQFRQLNHDLIWETLSAIPTEVLFERAKTALNAERQGWYLLAAISKSNGANFRKQIVDLEEWRSAWPTHSANTFLPADLQLILQLADQQAMSIAAFLPLSGRLEGVGKAIREGIMAAYYDDISNQNITPNIQFFDAANQDINVLYDQAASAGIELIIGPLDKKHVASISARESLPVPVLALNSPEADQKPSSDIPTDSIADSASELTLEQKPDPSSDSAAEPNSELNPNLSPDEELNLPDPAQVVSEFEDEQSPSNIFYFGLAIESEAKQVAERAWRDGHRRALIIAPSSTWGNRGVDAFRETWQELGGELVDDKRYQDQRSYSKLIEGAVGVDKSKNRKRQLQRLLGTNIEFEPRRRKDIDFVFLLAYPSQARQFMPLLAFHYASDIPVYATSQAYSNDTKIGLSDLNGLRFTTMPWHFDNELNERQAMQSHGDNKAPYQSLYALGVDAYHMYPRLEQLQIIQQAQFYGTTGRIRLSEDNVIERTQTWAEIRGGVAVELNNVSE